MFFSIFEGLGENFFITFNKVNNSFINCAIIHDFIPKNHIDAYFYREEDKKWYNDKFEQINSLDLLLTNSEFTKQQTENYFPNIPVVSISSAYAHRFSHLEFTEFEKLNFFAKYGIIKPFILNVGGLDPRKNIDTLLLAFNKFLSFGLEYQLVVPCGGQSHLIEIYRKKVMQYSLRDSDVLLLPHVSDADLVAFYNLCYLFVFPSLEEGFGLPALEAMACGAPVIGSNTTSIPEVIGMEDALFCPTASDEIAEKMRKAVTDEDFRSRLIDNANKRASLFSWNACARKALETIEETVLKHKQAAPAA